MSSGAASLLLWIGGIAMVGYAEPWGYFVLWYGDGMPFTIVVLA